MNRTYNIFVDNGLYIYSHYLKKPIDEITNEDIKNNIDIVIEKLVEFVFNNPKLTYIGFSNSSLANVNKNKIKKENASSYIKDQFKTLLNNIGSEERCSICGKNNIKRYPELKYRKMLSRCLMPMFPSNTFYNYSNNLQIINVCPICLSLSLISLLNMRKAGYAIIYNSDQDTFMEGYTKERQAENEKQIKEIEKSKEKGSINSIIEQIEWFIEKDKINKGYIQTVIFNNSGQSVYYDDKFISRKEIELIKELQKRKLYEEFKKLNLFNLILSKRLSSRYQDYLVDYNAKALKSSLELFEFIDMEVNILGKEMLELIKIVCKRIHDADIKNYMQDIKNIIAPSKFEDLLLRWQEEYKFKTGENLFPSGLDDYHKLCNYKLNQSIIKRMISQFIILGE